jgi:hypothetical protein
MICFKPKCFGNVCFKNIYFENKYYKLNYLGLYYFKVEYSIIVVGKSRYGGVHFEIPLAHKDDGKSESWNLMSFLLCLHHRLLASGM